jgi:hypothetical protein
MAEDGREELRQIIRDPDFLEQACGEMAMPRAAMAAVRPLPARLNRGIISAWCTSDPAIRCGKQETNSV